MPCSARWKASRAKNGQIDYLCANLGVAAPLINGEAIALLSQARSPIMAEDRELFRVAMAEIGLDCPRAEIARSMRCRDCTSAR